MKDAKYQRPELKMTETIREIPLACQDELAAVEFLEKQRWGNSPCCIHCGSTNCYKMMNAKTGGRSARFLWRCRDCKKQYTIRVGMVFEESRIELRHWVYAFWRGATSKKGVAALEIMRHTGLSYKSALFLMHRIRWAMAPSKAPTFKGDVEADETYVGGKPRRKNYERVRADDYKRPASNKIQVVGIVERNGKIQRQVNTDVTHGNVRKMIVAQVDRKARLLTDESRPYWGLNKWFKGGHETVNHSIKEYARGDVNTNTIESSFALVKRGLHGIYHAVSQEHLHRYLAHFDFLWNCRKMNDGDRTVLLIQSAEGKRLMYHAPGAA
ncbi:MAG: IS1595 family transposase [Anaerolineae bacterium]|nr:IS1595 family transposase [Phycisphaerae bacterium]